MAQDDRIGCQLEFEQYCYGQRKKKQKQKQIQESLNEEKSSKISLNITIFFTMAHTIIEPFYTEKYFN